MRLVTLSCAFSVVACIGCAHHRNDYAYAPPYAPPVYPQPQPVNYTAPAAPPAVVMPAAGVPAAAVPGPVTASHSTPCPQDCGQGPVVGEHVVVEGGGQTPPCPPGP